MSLALEKSDYTLKNALLWGNSIGHFKKANEGPWKDRVVQRIGHGVIGTIEFIPVLGQILSLVELATVKIFDSLNKGPKATGGKQPAIVHFHPKNLAEATTYALNVVKSGDAGIKSIDAANGIDWIVGSMKDPANPKYREPNNDLKRAKHQAGNPEFIEKLDVKTLFNSGKAKVEFIPISPKAPLTSPPTDTKLTSLSLMSPKGDGVIFYRTGQTPYDYATGLMWDASKLRHNTTCAYWKEDAYSSWRGWKRCANKLMLLAPDKFKSFLENLLPSYDALKAHAKNYVKKHNELLAHTSKEALTAVFIRSGPIFEHPQNGLKWARLRSICETIKIKKELGKELPILVLNNNDDKGTTVYTIEEQKKDWQTIVLDYSYEWGDNPNKVADNNKLYGLSQAEIEAYFANH